jgi:shikimate dehydrogenase
VAPLTLIEQGGTASHQINQHGSLRLDAFIVCSLVIRSTQGQTKDNQSKPGRTGFNPFFGAPDLKAPTVNTKLVILLGNPLGQSVSPAMHNRVFLKREMDYCYLPVEVGAEDLQAVFAGLTRMRVAGFNVTIPHKVAKAMVDELDPLAEAMGAVNTICMEGGNSRGYNTDGEGFLRSLETEAQVDVRGKTVLILGCGGAARAIAMTLAERGAGKILLSNRARNKAERLATEINARIAPCAEVVGQTPVELSRASGHSHILVNTTSLGMHPHSEAAPIDLALLKTDQVVADIVYNPRRTRLLEAARDKGCRTVPGLGMLIYQGAAAFRLWTGREPLVAEMFAAAEADLSV